jgi:hypothetical protein
MSTLSTRLTDRLLWSTLLLVMATAAATESPTPPSTDAHELSGVWFGAGNLDPNNSALLPIEGGERPFTAAGLAIYQRRQQLAAAGIPERQPADECVPHGVPAVVRLPTPLQIIQTPGQVTIIHEASRNVRLIYMEEQHPSRLAATFLGHSVGHWQADTLIVDTIGMRANWLDITGAPTSAQMHVSEHYRKLMDGKVLENLMTIDDPMMYTRPWTTRREYFWSPEERVQEYICEESLRLEPGVARLKLR